MSVFDELDDLGIRGYQHPGYSSLVTFAWRTERTRGGRVRLVRRVLPGRDVCVRMIDTTRRALDAVDPRGVWQYDLWCQLSLAKHTQSTPPFMLGWKGYPVRYFWEGQGEEGERAAKKLLHEVRTSLIEVREAQ